MRKTYLDNIRSVVVLLVVIYHVIMMFTNIIPLGAGSFAEVQYQDAYMYLVYPWFMVILFVVSGMSTRFYLDKHTTKEFVRSRTVKLLVPSTLSLFVFHWITGYFSMSMAGAFDTMPEELPSVIKYFIMVLSGQGVLWYIQLLWLFSMVLAIFHKLEKGRLYNLTGKMNFPLIIALVIPLWAFAQILNTPVITVYRFGLYGFSFFVGYYIFAHDEIINRISKYWLFTTIATVIMGIAYTVIYFGQNFADAPVNRSAFNIVFCWTAVLCVFGIFKRFFDRDNGFFRFIGKRSFGLYIFHYTPLAAAAYYIYPVEMPCVFKYLICAVAAFAGGYLLNELFSRIPFFRWVLLGISKKKAKGVEANVR